MKLQYVWLGLSLYVFWLVQNMYAFVAVIVVYLLMKFFVFVKLEQIKADPIYKLAMTVNPGSVKDQLEGDIPSSILAIILIGLYIYALYIAITQILFVG